MLYSTPMKRHVSLSLSAVLLLGSVAAFADDTIQLKDGTKVSGTVVQKDSDNIYFQLPRASVASVNGAPLPPPLTVGAVAPVFTAMDVAGHPQALADANGQATLLQFWASWCPHCRSDLPYMKELFTQSQGKGLRLLTVSVDQDAEKLKAFLAKEQVLYPVISAMESAPDLPDRYEMQGIPGYYLIDAKGKIVKVWYGALTEGKAGGKTELESILSALPAQS